MKRELFEIAAGSTPRGSQTGEAGAANLPTCPRNLKVTTTSDGFLVTADASKPAPEFAAMLHSLAHPDKYQGNTDPAYRRAVDRINAAFRRPA